MNRTEGVKIDTKSRILSVAIDLFALNGYEKTSMRDIAKEVDIRAASIYYFYESKEAILDAVFCEFESNFSKYRNPPRAILAAVRTKPLQEVLSMMFYHFGDSAERERMIMISRVVFSLQYTNDRALALYRKVVEQDATEYGIEVLSRLNRIEKIKKMEYYWIAYLMNAFALAIFRESIFYVSDRSTGDKKYLDGIEVLCAQLAKLLAP